MVRIVGGREYAIVDFAIPLDNIGSLRLGQALDLFHIAPHGIGEIREIERDHFRVGQTQHAQPHGFRQRPPIAEVGIGEMGEPIEIVVDRMINAAFVLAAKAKVQ